MSSFQEAADTVTREDIHRARATLLNGGPTHYIPTSMFGLGEGTPRGSCKTCTRKKCACRDKYVQGGGSLDSRYTPWWRGCTSWLGDTTEEGKR